MTVFLVFENPKKWIAECEHCRGRIEIDLPCPAKKLCAINNIFDSAHKDCKPPKEGNNVET